MAELIYVVFLLHGYTVRLYTKRRSPSLAKCKPKFVALFGLDVPYYLFLQIWVSLYAAFAYYNELSRVRLVLYST
jgi:hypothetical protein